MIVVPKGDASGRFDVYSANDGVNKTYTVDLRAESCERPDYEHRELAGECKHIQCVKLALGLMPVPAGVDLDEALVYDREKSDIDPEPEPPAMSWQAVATDGGELLEERLGYSVHFVCSNVHDKPPAVAGDVGLKPPAVAAAGEELALANARRNDVACDFGSDPSR